MYFPRVKKVSNKHKCISLALIATLHWTASQLSWGIGAELHHDQVASSSSGQYRYEHCSTLITTLIFIAT